MAKKVMISEEDETRKILNKIRLLNEDVQQQKQQEKKTDAIAITDDPKFGNLALRNQVDQFRSTVDSGAQFSTPKDGKVSESPLIYVPSNGNVIFSGIIPSLNNMKWQMVLKTTTGNGCFIWSDGLILNKENLQILNKLFGFYQNWKDQWNSEARDLDSIANNDFTY